MSTSACRRCTKGLAYSHYVLRTVRRREETSREKVCRQPELRDTRSRHRVHSTRRKDVRVCGGQDNLYPALDTGVRNLLWVMFIGRGCNRYHVVRGFASYGGKRRAT